MSGQLLTAPSKTEISQEEAQHTSYEREREGKARLAAAKEAKEKGTVVDFLKYVVEGEQDKAEELLQVKPGLALEKGTVTDLSKREFKHITGFQYAVWALDWHMCQMLLQYMSVEVAESQFIELEEKGTAYGKHFSLVPLINALDTYAKTYSSWSGAKCEQHWCKAVGGSQLLLPAHVVNEYCHPIRSFYPCPKFDDESLPRNRQCNGSEWFTGVYNGGKLGDRFGILRYSWNKACRIERASGDGGMVKQIRSDSEALQTLSKIRQQQLKNLKSELRYLAGVNHFLNAYFPQALTSTVLGYLR